MYFCAADDPTMQCSEEMELLIVAKKNYLWLAVRQIYVDIGKLKTKHMFS